MELSAAEREALRLVATMRKDPVCPSCGALYVDPQSPNGWCVRCDSRRERLLEQKRAWWERTGSARRRERSDDLSEV